MRLAGKTLASSLELRSLFPLIPVIVVVAVVVVVVLPPMMVMILLVVVMVVVVVVVLVVVAAVVVGPAAPSGLSRLLQLGAEQILAIQVILNFLGHI